MNIKRILAVMAVFSLLTGVACADDIMEIVPDSVGGEDD